MPSYAPLKDLPHAEKMRALRNPEIRRRLLAEEDPSTAGISIVYKQASTWQMTFPMGQPLNYFPDPQNNVAAIAARRGCDPREAAYDLLLEHDGRATWRVLSGCTRQSIAENTMFRFKRLFGGRLWARGLATQHGETMVKCAVFNRMTQLGMPETVRTEG